MLIIETVEIISVFLFIAIMFIIDYIRQLCNSTYNRLSIFLSFIRSIKYSFEQLF